MACNVIYWCKHCHIDYHPLPKYIFYRFCLTVNQHSFITMAVATTNNSECNLVSERRWFIFSSQTTLNYFLCYIQHFYDIFCDIMQLFWVRIPILCWSSIITFNLLETHLRIDFKGCSDLVETWGPILLTRIKFNPSLDVNYLVWYEITYPFANFECCTRYWVAD